MIINVTEIRVRKLGKMLKKEVFFLSLSFIHFSLICSEIYYLTMNKRLVKTPVNAQTVLLHLHASSTLTSVQRA